MDMKSVYFFTGMAIAVTSCSGIADSGFRVEGRVVDSRGVLLDDCMLERVAQRDGRVADSHAIDGVFSSTFTTAPGGSRFYLTVRCRGVKQTYKSALVEVVGTERYHNPIDLGTIQLSE